MKNNTIVLSLAIVAIILGGYAVWTTTLVKPEEIPANPETPQGTICTMDAMQCGDGSWVGRTGPDCQFVCPKSTSTNATPEKTTVEVKLNARVTPILESLTPLSVIEDSRCPKDVQCIQAGTVRVSVKLESGLGTSVQTFTVGQTITTETEAITLTSVQPEKISTKTILPADYRFTFTVSKR